MDKRPTPAELNDGPSMSGPSGTGGQLNETATPPIFSQYAEADFPSAAELPVPNVSPMTAHVLPPPFFSSLIQVSSCYSPPILCFI